jgi:DNA (cytosine-5)-methyltransferase 1
MAKPRLLDLFCCAGGAGMGYHLAGFEVVGVDISFQKHYPFEFHQADALEYLKEHGHEFDVIHASPPCQAYSRASMQWRKDGKNYPDLIVPVRELLKLIGKPYIIENVPGAKLINPIVLTGAHFGLKVRRKRLFETSFTMPYFLLHPDRQTNFKMGRPIREGEEITPVGHFSNIAYARREMQIDWMTGAELTQAIPPAYTEFIGRQIINCLA